MTPQEYVNVAMEMAAKIITEEILQSLTRLGEECLTRIRTRSKSESWIDQTGNLRSSIGYAVFSYGKKVIGSTFESVPGPNGDGTQGSANGREYVNSLAEKFAETYALVVVAGMDYAEYVEAIDSKDVLASTEIWAKSRVDKYLKDAKDRAETRIKEFISAL